MELVSIYRKISNANNKLWRITIDTNPEDCNLHCIMCEEHSEYSTFKKEIYKSTGKSRRVMPEEWIQRIIEEARGLGVKEIIPTTMGDPLVSKSIDTITQLVRTTKMKLNLTHNGTFPGKSVEQWALQLIPITKDIKISWNGASSEIAESIMKGINYQTAVGNLKELINCRDQHFANHRHYCQITLQLTFMRNNMFEIEKILELAAELGVDRIKGHHLWVHFPEIASQSFNHSAESAIEWNGIVERAKSAIKQYRRLKDGAEIRLENFHPINNIQTDVIPYDYECPFLERELWISATGRNTTLKQVIQSESYNELIKNYKSKVLCKKCQMRRPAQS
ncbi:MAG: radical SAM protein [Bacteroidales bacterium]|nr:radical SAM protein [Bacteroidales bacterium]